MGEPVEPPLALLLAAGPRDRGIGALLDEALARTRAGARVVVFLTEDGLDLLSTEVLSRIVEHGIPVSLCARSARARRIEPAAVERSISWSSLTAFVRDLAPDARLWSAFP